MQATGLSVNYIEELTAEQLNHIFPFPNLDDGHVFTVSNSATETTAFFFHDGEEVCFANPVTMEAFEDFGLDSGVFWDVITMLGEQLILERNQLGVAV